VCHTKSVTRDTFIKYLIPFQYPDRVNRVERRVTRAARSRPAVRRGGVTEDINAVMCAVQDKAVIRQKTSDDGRESKADEMRLSRVLAQQSRQFR
jgi:hypothetical protein